MKTKSLAIAIMCVALSTPAHALTPVTASGAALSNTPPSCDEQSQSQAKYAADQNAMKQCKTGANRIGDYTMTCKVLAHGYAASAQASAKYSCGAETICGTLSKSQYCRLGQCLPPNYTLEAPFENFVGLYSLSSPETEISKKIDAYANSGTSVCVTGSVTVSPQSFPEDLSVKAIVQNSGQALRTTRTLVSFKISANPYGNEFTSFAPGVSRQVYVHLFNAESGEPLACGVDANIDHLVVTDLSGRPLADVLVNCPSNLGGALTAHMMVPIAGNWPIYFTSSSSTLESMPTEIVVK